ncbi:hypothetical protein HNP46_005773 [Pseudomonas nitritireducens]|uniref:Uncharacterized protein n=1 Tax=Pseudomonas nitroreducens TaxID=46680 RepID=A0A7W7KQM0_PSENT|nr:hypothetical protein [Pseudomonas nitritireducens]MBB4866866.1 hypothetical protein [Pseudomonas nitritireducens]
MLKKLQAAFDEQLPESRAAFNLVSKYVNYALLALYSSILLFQHQPTHHYILSVFVTCLCLVCAVCNSFAKEGPPNWRLMLKQNLYRMGLSIQALAVVGAMFLAYDAYSHYPFLLSQA